MALLTDRKFIHFNRKSDFEALLNANAISDKQIVFLKDAQEIWTHGTYYGSVEQFLDETNKDSTNAVSVAAVYKALADDEKVIAAALNDLNDKYTNLDSSKQDVISDLDTIRENAQSGASKVSNVQADWNAESGLAQILHKPDLSVYENKVTSVNGQTGDVEVVVPQSLLLKGITPRGHTLADTADSYYANELNNGEAGAWFISYSNGDILVKSNDTSKDQDGRVCLSSSWKSRLNYGGMTWANVGDILLVYKQSSLIVVYKVMSINEAGETRIGLMSPNDKIQVNKISNIEGNVNNLLGKIDKRLPYSTDSINIGNAGNGAYTNVTAGRTNWLDTSTAGAAIKLGNLQIAIDNSGRLYSRNQTNNIWNVTNQLKNITETDLNNVFEPSVIGYTTVTNGPSETGNYTVYTFTSSDYDGNGFRSILQIAINRNSGNQYMRTCFKKVDGSGTDFTSTDWKLVSPSVTSVNGQTGAVTLSIPNDSNLVHKTGNETISGTKSFGGENADLDLNIGGTSANIVLSASVPTDALSGGEFGWISVTGKNHTGKTLQQALDERNNVQADWNLTTTTAADYIKNKPTIKDELSSDYEPSDLENEDLELASGDTYETAFGKLEKAIIDNELVVTAAITDLDARILNTESLATVAKSGSYNDLTNRPTIPTKTSDLTNDSGFITNAPVTSVNGQTGAVTVNVPVTSVNGQTGAVTITETQLSKGTATGTGNAVTDINVSNHQITLVKGATYATQSDIDTSIANLVDSAPETLDTLNELAAALGDDPNFATTVANQIGQKYTKPGTGIPASDLASAVQTSLGKADSAIQSVKVNGTALTPDTNKTVNVSVPTKTSDLTNDSEFIQNNQTTITIKANEDAYLEGGGFGSRNIISVHPGGAYVEVGESEKFYYNDKEVATVDQIPDAVTESTVSGWGFTKNTGTYSKPSGGIPKTDLASAVQTSLGKADTALQSFTETDPTVPSHVKSITQQDITNWNNKLSSAPVTSVNGQTGAVVISDATTTTNGLMSSNDKIKLNELKNSVKVFNVTASSFEESNVAIDWGDIKFSTITNAIENYDVVKIIVNLPPADGFSQIISLYHNETVSVPELNAFGYCFTSIDAVFGLITTALVLAKDTENEESDNITAQLLKCNISNKQDAISDLNNIRNNAEEGSQAWNALSNYQELLVSGKNIKTINDESILQKGNISIYWDRDEKIRDKYENQYLTFEIVEPGTIEWQFNGGSNYARYKKQISYNINDQGWNTTDATNDLFTIGTFEVGDIIQFKGNASNYGEGANLAYNYFSGTASFNIYGNILSLRYNTNELSSHRNSTIIVRNLFEHTNVINAKNLILPYVTISACYCELFFDCKKLISAPELPAPIISGISCYKGMFSNCTNLEIGPKILARSIRTGVDNCNYSLSSMFSGCNKLKLIYCLLESVDVNNTTTFYDFTKNVASTGTFCADINAEWPTGINGIPVGWQVCTPREFLENVLTKVNNIENNAVTSVNGMTGAVTIENQLSNDYSPSTLINEDLVLESGDTYEVAFGKLEKTINDNENITAAALTDLDSRLNLLHLPQSLDDIPDGSTRKLSDYATITSVNSSLATKQNTLVSGTNIKTINNESILGSGNITIQGGGGDTNIIETVKVNGTALTPDSNKAVNITSVPGSIVTQDATHRFVSDTEKTTWNGKQNALEHYTENNGHVNISTYVSEGDINIVNYDDNGGWPVAEAIFGSNGIELNAKQTFTGGGDEIEHTVTLSFDGFKYDNKQIATVDQIPSAVTESTVSGWGFTKNAGTITGITMNGASKGTSGVVDLGTVATANNYVTGGSVNSSNGTISLNRQGLSAASVTGLNTYVSSMISTAQTATGGYDDTYVAKAGDTMTGALTVNAAAANTVNIIGGDNSSGNQIALNVGSGTHANIFQVFDDGSAHAVVNGTLEVTPSSGQTGLQITSAATTDTALTTNGKIIANQFVKSGGTSGLLLKADGSVMTFPAFSSADNGKVLSVVNGSLAWVTPTAIYSGTSTPDSNTGNNGDLYLQTS